MFRNGAFQKHPRFPLLRVGVTPSSSVGTLFRCPNCRGTRNRSGRSLLSPATGNRAEFCRFECGMSHGVVEESGHGIGIDDENRTAASGRENDAEQPARDSSCGKDTHRRSCDDDASTRPTNRSGKWKGIRRRMWRERKENASTPLSSMDERASTGTLEKRIGSNCFR